MKIKNNQGFTLMELLVSVAIIGILAAVSISIFSEYRKKSYDTHALATAKNMLTSFNAALADHGGIHELMSALGETELSNGYTNGSWDNSSEATTILPGLPSMGDQILMHYDIVLDHMNGQNWVAFIAAHCKGSTDADLYGGAPTRIVGWLLQVDSDFQEDSDRLFRRIPDTFSPADC